jgi:hypothetical protein
LPIKLTFFLFVLFLSNEIWYNYNIEPYETSREIRKYQ